jgi:predicted RNA-binding Zn-ribbon protein involved in translation (DUF1610 family)
LWGKFSLQGGVGRKAASNFWFAVSILKKRAPRFFCDNCGAEVSRNEKACPRCGRFFASVRCPACGFSGEERLFSGGCPVCGYSAAPAADGTRIVEKKTPAGPLPVWVYIFSIFALLCVFAVLFFVVMR